MQNLPLIELFNL